MQFASIWQRKKNKSVAKIYIFYIFYNIFQMVLIFFSDKYEKMYNCSFYDYERISYKDRSHPICGWLCLFTTVAIWILYIPCIIVMSKKDFIKYSCYKLMTFHAILDLNLTLYSGFWSGFINITGNVYCHSPKSAFIIGFLLFGAWKAQTTTTVLLALNRCLESLNNYYAKILFNGKRIYFWMAIPILWGFQDIIWGPPGIFSPVYSVLSYNPHEGYFPDTENKYFDSFIFYYNFFIAISIVIIYSIFGIYIFVKSKRSKIATRRNAKVFGQILIVSLFLVMVMVFFMVNRYYQFPAFWSPWITYSFLVFNGLPAVIYLTLNKTMRKNVMKKIGSK